MRRFLKVLDCTKGYPLHLFRCFAAEWMLEFLKRSPFYICGTVTLFKNLFRFSFRIALKAPNGTPSILFLIFQQTGVSKIPNDPLFTILKTARFLSLRHSADFGCSRLVEDSVKSCALQSFFYIKVRPH